MGADKEVQLAGGGASHWVAATLPLWYKIWKRTDSSASRVFPGRVTALRLRDEITNPLTGQERSVMRGYNSFCV